MTIARLRRAEAAVIRGELAVARDLVVAEWQTRRSADLARLVDQLAARAGPDAFDDQLARCVSASVTQSLQALRELAGVDDPRFARWALDTLSDPPFVGVVREKFLRQLVVALDRADDPRVALEMPAVLRELELRLDRDSYFRRLERLWTARPASVRQPRPAELDVERAIEAALAGPVASSPALAALVAEVHAHPDDDAPRAVLGDALLELGDPRGELIQLQLARPAGVDPGARERELLARHGRRWLGPLADVLSFGHRHSRTHFVRGFVGEVDLVPGAELSELAADPAWSTVERIVGACPGALLRATPLPSLRALEVDVVDLNAFASRELALPRVTALAFRSTIPEALSFLPFPLIHALVPALAQLSLAHVPTPVELADLASIGVVDVAIDAEATPELADWLASDRGSIATLAIRERGRGRPWRHYARGDRGLLQLV